MKPASFTHVGRLPGLNEYTNACRGNAYGAARMKKDAEKDITWSIVQTQVPRYVKPVRLRLIWHEPPSGNGQRRDFDNIVFAKKFLLDAMVTNYVLKDDDLAHVAEVEERVELEPKGGNYGVQVHIEEIPQDGW